MEEQQTDRLLKIHLSEYEQLFDANKMYIRWQHEIVYLVMALISGAVIVIKALPEPFFSLSVLLLPIPITLLGFILTGLQARVVQIAYYIINELQPKVESLVNGQGLGWQQFLRQPPSGAGLQVTVMPTFFYYVPIWVLFVIASVSPIVFFYSFVPGCRSTWQVSITVLDILLVIGNGVAFYFVARPRIRRQI